MNIDRKKRWDIFWKRKSGEKKGEKNDGNNAFELSITEDF